MSDPDPKGQIATSVEDARYVIRPRESIKSMRAKIADIRKRVAELHRWTYEGTDKNTIRYHEYEADNLASTVKSMKKARLPIPMDLLRMVSKRKLRHRRTAKALEAKARLLEELIPPIERQIEAAHLPKHRCPDCNRLHAMAGVKDPENHAH